MKKHLLLTVATIVFLACSVMPMTQRPADASAEEYAVYSALIGSTFSDTQAKFLVIQDQTVTDRATEDYSLKNPQYFRQTFPALKAGVDTDYKAQNKTPVRLRDSFALKLKHVVVENHELEKIFKGAGSWGDFYSRYPNSQGIIAFSRVGFNADRSQARVYIEHTCGGLCGTGHYVLLEKGAEGWRVVKREMVWIS